MDRFRCDGGAGADGRVVSTLHPTASASMSSVSAATPAHRRLRPLWSPWPVVAAGLGWFVVLAILLHDLALVVPLWVGTLALLTLVGLLLVRPDAGAGPAGRTATLGIRVLTAAQVAALLDVPTEDVVEAMRGGQMPGNCVNGEWRVRARALVEWLDGPYARKP